MKKALLLCQQIGCVLEVSPARYQLIHELKINGYEVYVFFPRRILDQEIRNDIYRAVNTQNLSMKEIRNEIIRISPDYVIAFTYEDTNIIYPLPLQMKGTAFIYFNLEIYTPVMERNIQPEGRLCELRCRGMYTLNKIKEVIFTKQCKLFVIQDALRKRTSTKYWIRHANTVLIPNSYTYEDRDRVKEGCQGIIYSGGVKKNQVESLIQGLHALPDMSIAFSGWCDGWSRAQYKKIHKTHPGIRLYDQTLPPEKFMEFLKQYAVGLIWYSPTEDENINNIGMSSGKFFRHLSLGQPVIVNDCPGLSKIVNKYKVGVVIQKVSELEAAYRQIMENYPCFQSNIRKVYQKKFDFRKRIQPVLKQLEKM